MDTSILNREKPLILVVDDELVGRIYIEKALLDENYDVITADNGQQALVLAEQHCPNMIVLDVMMPIMDGYKACAAIRELAGQFQVPILMLTGLDDIDSVEKSFDSGATDFIVKPVNLPIFKQRVRYALKTNETNLDLYKHQQRQTHANKVAQLGYWDWDIETGHLYWSKEIFNILSVVEGEFENNCEAFKQRTHKDDCEKIQNAVMKSIEEGVPYSIEYRVDRPDKVFQVIHQHADLIMNDAGKVIKFLGIVQDVTKTHKAQDEIRYLAYYDSLTGLPNRTLFHNRLDYVLKSSKRQSNKQAIFIVDLDRFKNINDSLGHDIGDKFLQSVANRLKNITRETDTMARLGGDEFALIADSVSSYKTLEIIAQKILLTLSQSHYIDGNELISTGSIGISISSADDLSKEDLIRQADLAMYQAKENGGNQFCFYNIDMKSKAHQTLSIEKELRRALNNNEFEVYYQPKISVETNNIQGMEALIRWNHPDKGIVSPIDFIPIAEETGLIVPIGNWVMQEACIQAHKWHQNGFEKLVLSVNVSVRQFLNAGFIDDVNSVLALSEIDPRKLDLEITESCTMNNIELAIKILKALRKIGIRISLDDFGTGFSSLSFLNQLPIDTLKVDKAFIKNINSDGENSELAKLIITMAKSLGLSVVAEGVEISAQLEFLKKNKCDEFQGYLVSPPVSAKGFEELLKK